MWIENHPNPTLARENWTDLNGIWSFRFDDQDVGRSQGWQNGFAAEYDIRVPFCYQSRRSGVGVTQQHDVLWYSRTFEIGEGDSGRTVLIHFGAVDYDCTVWVNGIYVGGHAGGGTHFAADAGFCVHAGTNLLVVRAADSYSCEIPRGKQCWQEELTRCWYTPTGGIWKNVWMEVTGPLYVKKLRITPDIDRGEARAELYLNREAACEVRASVTFEDLPCGELAVKASGSHIRFTIPLTEGDYIDDVRLWSPDSPNLYQMHLTIDGAGGRDEIETYFGMREIACRGRDIFLNHQLLYQRLVLDQGYWPDTLMTPPDDEAIRRDIALTKEFGFNGARKHQKMEDARYYYWADRMGLLVWAECPSAYVFNTNMMENLQREWREFVEERYNNPCIITWVPLNESWGVRRILTDAQQQAFAASLYYMTKALDQTRLVSTNDGWETVEYSDLTGIHDYEADAERFRERYRDWDTFLKTGIEYKLPICRGHRDAGQPVLLTEYGGIAFADGDDKSWGYHEKAADADAFVKRLGAVTKELQSLDYCSGFCYTQLTDVMQETNGLLRADRTPKVPPKLLAPIFARRREDKKP